jgi:hypothetical protein
MPTIFFARSITVANSGRHAPVQEGSQRMPQAAKGCERTTSLKSRRSVVQLLRGLFQRWPFSDGRRSLPATAAAKGLHRASNDAIYWNQWQMIKFLNPQSTSSIIVNIVEGTRTWSGHVWLQGERTSQAREWPRHATALLSAAAAPPFRVQTL